MKTYKENRLPVTISRLIVLIILGIAILPVISFSKHTLDIFMLPKELVFQTLIVLALLLWLVKAWVEKKVSLSGSKLNIFILLFFAINVLSLAWSTSFHLSFRAVNNLTFRIILYFLIINSIDSEKQVNTAVNLLVLAAGLESVYGIIQHFGLDPFLGLNLKGKLNIIGTFGYHNFLSEWLVLVIPLLLYRILFESKKFFSGFVLLTSSVCMVLTQTRSAWLALIISVPFFLIHSAKKNKEIFLKYKKRIIAVSLAILVVTGFLMFIPLGKDSPSVVNRIKSSLSLKESTVKSRIVLWKAGINMIKEKPLLGWGVDTYKYHYLDYLGKAKSHLTPGEYIAEEAEDAHNEYLQAWVESGIAGFLLFVSVIVIYFREAFKAIKKCGNSKLSLLIIAFSAGIIGILIDSLFSFPFHITPIDITIWYIIGLTVASGRINERKNHQ